MITEEMKKIWRPGMVLSLFVLGFVFYSMFLEFYIDYFPNGSQNSGIFEESRELVETYGTRISAKEMDAYEAKLPVLHKEADRFVRESEIGKKHGILTYEAYAAFYSKANLEAARQGTGADLNETYADAMRLSSYLQGGETGNIEGRLYGASWMSEAYRARETYGADLEIDGGEPKDKKTGKETDQETDGERYYTNKEREHVKKVFFAADKMWQNVLPPEVPETTGAYVGYLLTWICLCVCMLLAPLLVHDRMRRMVPLQYSSKRGRSIYRCQFAAAMFTALIAATANLLLFGGLFLTHGTEVFFPCRMYSFAVMQFCWPNWTHGVWCLVLVAICYLTALGTAGIVFFLSQRCGNYIVMLLKILPVAVIMAVLSPKMTEDAFYFGNVLYRLSGVPYIELVCAGAIFAVGMVLCGLGKRQVEKDV